MLRILGKTTLFAVALVIGSGLSLPGSQRASAQEVEGCPVHEGAVGTGVSARGTARGSCFAGKHNQVNCRPRQYGQPDLFYNYYVPGTCGGVPAQMYLSPRPVPQLVGHTYYTYQPFMPHEMLYQHHRTYYRYYNQGRGLTRTKISWYRPPLSGIANIRIAR